MIKKHISPRIHHLTRTIASQLLPRYQDQQLCDQYAWWMLEAITKKSKIKLITEKQIVLTDDQLRMLDSWINKQVHEHVPLQYLIGSVPFADLEILIEQPILIPRPETEHWCMQLIEQLRALGSTPLTILDMCTGSGCIALALAQALPHATVYAADISPKALALAQKNAQHNNIPNITFLQSDLFHNIPPNIRFDLIVSNPPYIAEDEWRSLDPSVKNWEDKRALVAPQDGLAILEKITKHALHLLPLNTRMAQNNIPQLIVEIGYNQGHAVRALMQETGFEAKIIQDLAGKDRIVSGRVKHVAPATQKQRARHGNSQSK